jgi:hypothetical protein
LVWPTASAGGGEGKRVAANEAGFGFGNGYGFDPLQMQWVEDVIKRDSRFALFTQLATSSQEEDPHQESCTRILLFSQSQNSFAG